MGFHFTRWYPSRDRSPAPPPGRRHLSPKSYRLGLAVLGAVSCVFVLRSLGWLQLLELSTFDYLMRLRPPDKPDDRIVVVGLDEADFRHWGRSQVSDRTMARLLQKIQAQNPQVIGLDLYRSLATPPGAAELTQVLQTMPNLIGIAKVIGATEGQAVAGHPALVQTDRVAASDVVVDVDGRVRRGLLFPDAKATPAIEGLGWRVALEYLRTQGIQPDLSSAELRIRQTRFPAFGAQDGGYINADAGGYQILLNPRGGSGAFLTVPARDVLSGHVPTQLFTNRIVMIGDMSAGASDAFFTAHSSTSNASPRPMFGVEIHAQITSQIVSAVLDRRPLIQPLAKLGVWWAVGMVSWISAVVSADRRWTHPYRLLLLLGLLSGLGFGSYSALLAGSWLPIVPMTLAAIMAAAIALLSETQDLKILSDQDGLTKLSNRRVFNERLEQEWQRGLRTQTHLGLILCDVDCFKSYNDTYGHTQGDDCLRQVAIALQRSVKRPIDVVARYGGEEFVLLLPNTDTHGALQVAKLIQGEMAALQLPHRKSTVAPFVTLSLGIFSIIPALDQLPTSLVEGADQGLYSAKQQGRNQAVIKVAHPPENSTAKNL